jgi:wyosine [tRNA(Phe)-imidazoG37] synthetase (radical SAM superfamily)
MKPALKYIYGPVPSWRLGSSLGIDLLSQEEKICNFDCTYCQLGATKEYTAGRKVYVPVEEVLGELEGLSGTGMDYITFSGRGEPALAANLGAAIKAVKSIRREPVAVLTNGSLMASEEVRNDLASADFVVAKCDACSPELLREINRPAHGVEFGSIGDGIKAFKRDFPGKLALQIMFLDNNKNDVHKFVGLTNDIKPDEVQINTPLRSCSARPLSQREISGIRGHFVSACRTIRVVSVYDKRPLKDVASLSGEDTLKRRGKVT